MYDYHWVGFISILFLRLHIVFNNSILVVYRSFNVISILIIVTFAAGSTVNYFTLLSGVQSPTASAVFTSVLVLVMLLYSQVLAFVFVRRLFKLNALATKDDQLILSMTMYVLCCVRRSCRRNNPLCKWLSVYDQKRRTPEH